MFCEELIKPFVPDPRGLPQSIYGFVQAANELRDYLVFKVWRLRHVYLLVNFAMKKGHIDIKLCYLKVVDNEG